MNYHHAGALRLVTGTLAGSIRPIPPLPFRDWLAKNIVLVDGPKKGDFWSLDDAPYLGEIADCLDIAHPSNLVTVRKAQQTGVSILALGWSLYLAETAPDNIIYGVPGIDALQEMNSRKLSPMIDEWQKATHKRVILPAVSRSGRGSTTYEKVFPGGALSLANANVAMELSAKTARYGVKDEVSKWQDTPNGDDPEVLFFGRFTAFRRQKLYKIFELSTPELDAGDELGEAPGHCRIDRSFRRSDQRFWHVRCPECREEFIQSSEGFVLDRAHPHRSSYECPNPNCGHHVSESERVFAVRGGHYIPMFSGPDRHPGFHVDAFMSLMMSYEAIAEDWIKASGKGEPGIKGYTNLVLALPYAMKGNAPDWQRLMERREDYPQGVIPEAGLLFVAGADVQHNGIYAEAVAFGDDRQSWTIDAQFFAGATDDPNAGAWVLLDGWKRDAFRDAHGQDRYIEALAVDAGDGNRNTQALTWCARRPNAYAIAGQHGRGVPAISVPARRSVKKNGKRQKIRGALAWPVGTWSLKGELYGNLHKIGIAAGEGVDPGGYCHFGKFLGEEYFRQLTAEYFNQKMVRGRLVEGWERARRENHFLDCRVYAMAMAELLGLSKLTKDQWAALRARLLPQQQVDLLSAPSEQVASQPSPPASAKAVISSSAAAIAKSKAAWKRR